MIEDKLDMDVMLLLRHTARYHVEMQHKTDKSLDHIAFEIINTLPKDYIKQDYMRFYITCKKQFYKEQTEIKGYGHGV